MCTVGTHLRNSLTRQRGRSSGRRVGLAIRRSRVRVLFRPLAGFVLGRPEIKSSATPLYSQLVTSCQLGFLSCYVVFELFLSKYLNGVPVN